MWSTVSAAFGRALRKAVHGTIGYPLPIAGYQFSLNAPSSLRASVTSVAGWRRMTASGIVMSALPRRTDIPKQKRQVRKVPGTEVKRRSLTAVPSRLTVLGAGPLRIQA
jgi:hypothetical protein